MVKMWQVKEGEGSQDCNQLTSWSWPPGEGGYNLPRSVSAKLIVSKVHHSVTLDEFTELFKKYGEIRHSVLERHRKFKRTTRGFVIFQDARCADVAQAAINGTGRFKGRTQELKVRV